MSARLFAINMGMRTNADLTFLMKLLNSLHLMKKFFDS